MMMNCREEQGAHAAEAFAAAKQPEGKLAHAEETLK